MAGELGSTTKFQLPVIILRIPAVGRMLKDMSYFHLRKVGHFGLSFFGAYVQVALACR
jgi:hypothetical protein